MDETLGVLQGVVAVIPFAISDGGLLTAAVGGEGLSGSYISAAQVHLRKRPPYCFASPRL